MLLATTTQAEEIAAKCKRKRFTKETEKVFHRA